MFPAVVQVKAPVGIKVMEPPPCVNKVTGVIVTTAAVPLMKVVGPVGAMVVALAIVDALAVVAVMPKTAKAALTRRI